MSKSQAITTGKAESTTAAPPRRRWSYSLRTLMIVTALGSFGVWAADVAFAVYGARSEFALRDKLYQAGVFSTAEVCEASQERRAAEARIPFNATAAGTSHRARLQELERRFTSTIPVALYDDPDEPLRDIEAFKRYRQEADDWLRMH